MSGDDRTSPRLRRCATWCPKASRHRVEQLQDLVGRAALGGDPTYRADGRPHPFGSDLLTMRGARGTRDGLVHQSPAEIVGARVENDPAAIQAALDPADLDVVDRATQRKPGDRVHLHDLLPAGPPARTALAKHRRLHVNER